MENTPKITHVDALARQKAKRARELPANSECPFTEQLIMADPSPSGVEILHEAKTDVLYPRLARIMEPIIDAAYENYKETGCLGGYAIDQLFGLVSSHNIPQLDAYWNSHLVHVTLQELTQREARKDADYVVLNELLPAMRNHGKTIPIRLEALMLGGIGTAVSSICNLTDRMNRTLRTFGYDKAERLQTIKGSTSPIVTAANISVSYVEKIQQYAGEWEGRGNLVFSFVNSQRLKYSNEFEAFVVEQLEKLDIPEEEQPVLGCPILLNQGQIQRLWQWGVDMAGQTRNF